MHLRRLAALSLVGLWLAVTASCTTDSAPPNAAAPEPRLQPASTAFAPTARPSVTVLGGESAVSGAVLERLQHLTGVRPVRLAGPSRIDTAVAISEGLFEPGVAAVHVATASAFPDALVGGVAAARDRGPVLLVYRDSLPDAVAAELRRLRPARVVILGGERAISRRVASEIGRVTNVSVQRVAGATRFETAAQVAGAAFDHADVAFIATGESFPDALAGVSAAAVRGGPILLAARDTLPAATAATLGRLRPERVVVLGGAAAVSDAVRDAAAAASGARHVERWAGANRFETAAEIAARAFPDQRDRAYVASGENFPDALAGGAAAASTGAPMLLVDLSTVPSAVESRLAGLSALPAFPGAEGFGARAMGGRGGRVMAVTSLADSGAGTFRACAEARGPRICVFRTGGIIELQSQVKIDEPFITIAGQTAPGDGIAIKSLPDYANATLKITAHDVVIRGLRIRSGPSTEPSSMRRGITIEEGAHRIIIDRSSISWATDENINLTDGARDITIQWSIVAEALSRSTHPEGEHSKGIAISGKQFTSSHEAGRVSVHHNLLAHNRDRNARHAAFGVVDFVNNVIYNWGRIATEANDAQAAAPLNVIGNFYKAGPDRSTLRYEVKVTTSNGHGAAVHVRGNIGPNRTGDEFPDDRVVDPAERKWLIDTSHPAPPVSTTSARDAYDAVMERSGAFPRDSVDRRIAADVRDGTGAIIDSPAEVGGWPALKSGVAPQDSDRDGMPDDWETARGLDPHRNDSGEDRNGDGYTNIEEYINSLLG